MCFRGMEELKKIQKGFLIKKTGCYGEATLFDPILPHHLSSCVSDSIVSKIPIPRTYG